MTLNLYKIGCDHDASSSIYSWVECDLGVENLGSRLVFHFILGFFLPWHSAPENQVQD